MSPAQPDGARWPADGALSPGLVEAECTRPLSLYVHVPFCRVRCGYCDFNTYTVGFGPGAQIGDYAPSVLAEASLATRVMAEAGLPERAARTVFFGGGTPTMLDAAELIAILEGLRARVGIDEGAEVTLEANPDTVTREDLRALADAGFTRVSFGMQSAVARILATLDRTHTPERVPQVVEWAKDAGLATSIDLIYGTPGESLADWEASLRAALSYDSEHMSAYALVVEEGTKMGAQVSRGELPTLTMRLLSTSLPTPCWARRATPGTRSPTLRALPHLTGPRGFPQRPSSMLRATIWRTGGTGTGGASDRVLTLTLVRRAGGTSRTRGPTRVACARAVLPRQRARFWARRSASLSASCWGFARRRAWSLTVCRASHLGTRPWVARLVVRRRVGASPRLSPMVSLMELRRCLGAQC